MTRTKLVVCSTHSLLYIYGEDGFAIACAVSEISRGAYPYQRTWEGETDEQYEARQAELWGDDPMGDWHGRNE